MDKTVSGWGNGLLVIPATVHKKTIAFPAQVAGLPALTVAENQAGGFDTIEPVDEPTIIDGHHGHSRPVGAGTPRLSVPVMDMDAIRPIGGFLETNSQFSHSEDSGTGVTGDAYA